VRAVSEEMRYAREKPAGRSPGAQLASKMGDTIWETGGQTIKQCVKDGATTEERKGDATCKHILWGTQTRPGTPRGTFEQKAKNQKKKRTEGKVEGRGEGTADKGEEGEATFFDRRKLRAGSRQRGVKSRRVCRNQKYGRARENSPGNLGAEKQKGVFPKGETFTDGGTINGAEEYP